MAHVKASSTINVTAKSEICILFYPEQFFFSINPYIGEMLISVGIPEAQIGFYAGLVESIYSISECFFLLYVWTDLSNRIGRKPVLLICLLGITIGGTLFGFSQNVWQMVLSRTIAGMFSGCIG